MPHRSSGRPGRVPFQDHAQPAAVGHPGTASSERVRQYPAAAELFRQGDPAEDVFYLEHGLVKLLRSQADGTERIVGLRSSGSFLGAADAIVAVPLAATAITVGPSRLTRCGAVDFIRRLREDPAFSWRIHELHSRELYGETLHVADLMSVSARERLLQYLRLLAPALGVKGADGGIRIELPLRHWELAQLIGVAAPYLSQLLAELALSGEIRRTKGVLILLPPRSALAALDVQTIERERSTN